MPLTWDQIQTRAFAFAKKWQDASNEEAEQISVNVRAAEKTARLHDALKAGGYAGHRLEVYLVRLLFCFFAEDTGLFPKGSFQSLVQNARADGSDLAGRLSRLFEVLNTPDKELARQTKLPEWFRQFRYVNGGLFAEILPSADFDAATRQTLLDCCDFDWSGISPAIFGAMFQGVLDAETRRELGAHYTSEENILKVIEPLFLDELWRDRAVLFAYGLKPETPEAEIVAALMGRYRALAEKG